MDINGETYFTNLENKTQNIDLQTTVAGTTNFNGALEINGVPVEAGGSIPQPYPGTFEASDFKSSTVNSVNTTIASLENKTSDITKFKYGSDGFYVNAGGLTTGSFVDMLDGGELFMGARSGQPFTLENLDGTIYLNSQAITATAPITAPSFIKTGGTNIQYLMGDGSTLTQSATSGNSNFYLYDNTNSTTDTTPVSGEVIINSVSNTTATIVYISHVTRDNIDVEVFWKFVNTLTELYLQDQSLSTNYIQYNITAAPTIIVGNKIAIPVAVVNSAGTGATSFGAGHNILVSFFTNNLEVDTRLSTLETKNQNITATAFATSNDGTFTATQLITTDGVASQFLKGDGTLDQTDYLTNPFQWSTSTITFTQAGTALVGTSGYMPTSGIVNIGGSLVAVAQSSSSVSTRIFKSASLTSSVADGQKSGYIGTATFPKIYGRGGFNLNISFGIGDTNTAATSVCQMFCGILTTTTTPLFSSILGPNNIGNILGIGCDVGDSFFSFYMRGTSTGTKVATSISCTTPSTGYYNLNIYNAFGSNTVLLTLTNLVSDTIQTYTTNFSSGSPLNAIGNTLLLYPVVMRGMATVGGITNSAITHISRFQLSIK